MPRFGIKAQILVLSLGLATIPWSAWVYWEQLQQTTIETQARIQLIEARAIATSLVATQENISELLVDEEQSGLNQYAISTPVTSTPIRLDGLFDDWGSQVPLLEKRSSGFVTQSQDQDSSASQFGLALAQSAEHLFLALNVRDDRVQTRAANRLRLDYNDHIQLTYSDQHGALRRVLLPLQASTGGSGDLASYSTDFNWTYGVDSLHPITGESIASHRTGIQGYWRETSDGYAIELRMPTDALDSNQPRMHLAVIDVDQAQPNAPRTVIASLPTNLSTELNPLGLHAREFQNVIDQLKSTYARLWIFDRQGREWAYGGREAYDSNQTLEFGSQCISDALMQKEAPLHLTHDSAGSVQRITACYPITKLDQVLGVVVIDESASHVLAKEQKKIEQLALRTGLIIAALIVVLFLYAFFLARRIARLNAESSKSIDKQGRIERTDIRASKDFPDELGDLSRTMSNLLTRQKNYTTFIERIPQTLRHEISNPLNKLKTSLELFCLKHPQFDNDTYIQRINAGTDQISQITQHLTEATSLESAIESEPLQSMDLSRFLRRYLEAWEGQVTIENHANTAFQILGDPSRLEQLFDKLLDNAISFKSSTGRVLVVIEQEAHILTVRVENDGPILKTEQPDQLFAPMSSTRSAGDKIHLGLGLFIAKLIADKHQAGIRARNRADNTGVILEVTFNIQ